ncbi:Lrp/AsnC family transcriptional regulator [Methylobacterium oryzihabitans]|uniref:Lrp/AsnC family transcriptional regulator n=1 Tax=Methylobacterium oryzihabitans TaxID=2499852 RepID=A0A3S2VQ91_9HYPH|nr:Lrp/AsnC family transcriptional regulator [Methylobacterium oryzihabitans]RVU14468.1 Lrp/AsnC family transcriptional regulator [Methylobacterium oryzihabitans]
MADSVDLDGFDLKILAALQADGRLGNQELADRVNLSASQCSRRRLRLEERGVIRGYRADLAPGLLGLGIVVFTKVALAAHSRDNARRFADLVRGLDCVLEAHALTGDSDYLLKMIVPDLAALSAVVNDALLPHESVAHVRSSVVLHTLKEAAPLPLPVRR